MYLVPGGVWSGGVWSRGVSGLGGVWSMGGCLVHGGVSDPGGVPGQVLPPVDIQTPVNLLPCPKLRLRAVINVDLKCSGTSKGPPGPTSHNKTNFLRDIFKKVQGWRSSYEKSWIRH